MGEVISFISGKGGQGKTAVLANIAVGLALEGKKVLAIDLCYGQRQLDLALGMENMILYNIDDVFSDRVSFDRACVKCRFSDNLYLITAPLTKDIFSLDKDKFNLFISECRKFFDYVLIDCPSGTGRGLELCTLVTDRMIAVMTPDTAGVRGVDKIASSLGIEYKDRIALIINMIHPIYIKQGAQLSESEIGEILPHRIIGIIPFSFNLHIMINKAELPVKSNCKATVLYTDICKRILGTDVPLKNWEKIAKKF